MKETENNNRINEVMREVLGGLTRKPEETGARTILPASASKGFIIQMIRYWGQLIWRKSAAEPVGAKEFMDCFKLMSAWVCVGSAVQRNLMMYGRAGIGKSTLMDAMLSAIRYFDPRGEYLKVSAKRIGDIYAHRDDKETWSRITGPKCRVLFIDDLGMEEDFLNDYGTRVQPMALLLHDRFEKNLHTAVTTNLNREELMKKYDSRIMDRFNAYRRISYERESFR